MKKEKIDFKDIYVEDVLSEIKEDIQSIITLKQEEVQDISGDREAIADDMMREVLKDLIFNCKNNSEVEYRYDLLLVRDMDDVQAKTKLRCCLMLYYTALYYGRVELLQKMLSKGVKFTSLGVNKLALYLLDPIIADLLPEEDYIELSKKALRSLDTIYYSVIKLEEEKRRDFLRKFVVVAERDKNLIINIPSRVWTCSRLSIYDEETYKKASETQFNEIIANNCEFEKKENIARINELIQNTNFSLGTFFFHSMDTLLDVYSNDELVKLDNITISYIISAICDRVDLRRVKRLLERKPILSCYVVTCSKEFLNTFTDEEIIQLEEKNLNELQSNRNKYFPEEFGSREEAKVRKLLKSDKLSFFKGKKDKSRRVGRDIEY